MSTCLKLLFREALDNGFGSLVVQLSGNIYPSCTVKMPSSISRLVGTSNGLLFFPQFVFFIMFITFNLALEL
jgi:hypothetical protein